MPRGVWVRVPLPVPRRVILQHLKSCEATRFFLLKPQVCNRGFYCGEEAGESLTDFILKEKTEEAKRLLRYSDKSLTAIGSYLGFSSPASAAHAANIGINTCDCFRTTDMLRE